MIVVTEGAVSARRHLTGFPAVAFGARLPRRHQHVARLRAALRVVTRVARTIAMRSMRELRVRQPLRCDDGLRRGESAVYTIDVVAERAFDFDDLLRVEHRALVRRRDG